MPFIELEYDNETWCQATRGLENEPERGKRCSICFHLRLKRVMQYAKENGFDDVSGSTLYVTAAPCIECSKLIIQSGIKRVVYGEKYRLDDGITLLGKAGVEVVYINPDEYETK